MGENALDDGPETTTRVPRPPRKPAPRACALAWGLALTTAAAAQDPGPGVGLTIEHHAPGCVAAEAYPRLSACFRPDGALSRGRVYFRPLGAPDWFYVEMTGEPPCLAAVLPRPRKDLGAIEYAISGVDRDLVEVRTAEYTVPVTDNDTCRAGPMAPVVESAVVIIGSASGAEPVGFLTGDGVDTRLILGIAGGVAAVAAVAVLVGDGEEESPPPPAASWRSTLAVPGARGQVVVDGVQQVAVGPGAGAPSPSLGPGPHRLEAVLVDGAGRPGTWRFDLSAAPGSIRVVAGEVEETGPGHVTFRLTGVPGERAVFTFGVGGD